MIYLDDLKYMKLYKKQFLIPINKKDKRHGSAILLLSPSYEASNKLMNSKFILNQPAGTFHSYYIEKDILYTINNESRNLEIAHFDYTNIINEQPSVFIESTDCKEYGNLEECEINELYCRLGDKVIFFNEMYDENIFDEAAVYGTKYKSLLYNDRIRNNKEVFRLYAKTKQDNPWITKAFIDYSRYNKENLFVDLYYYNQAYLGNNNFTINKSIDMYFEFISRFINDKRITNAGYAKKTVFVPIDGWDTPEEYDVFDYTKVLNPISVFYKKMRLDLNRLHKLDDIDFVFFSDSGYFKMKMNNLNETDYRKFIRFIASLRSHENIIDDEPNNSPDAITASIVNKLEKNSGIVISNLTGDITSDKEEEKLKAELVKKIAKSAEHSVDEDQAINKMEEDKEIKKLISDLMDQADDNIKLSGARLNRINKAQDEFMQKKINNKSVRDMIEKSNKPKELEEKALPIKTINDEWKHLKAINFEKEYDLDADIIKCINSLSDTNKHFPISILSVDIEDASNSEDSIYLYTVKCEDYAGQRFTLKFYIPKLRDNRYMRLRGNEKSYSGQLVLLPISKTDEDTVQLATLYNKIFIRRYNTSTGRSNPYSSRLIKALDKCNSKKTKVIVGDNSRICSEYDLPIDYIDLAGKYSKIVQNNDKETITICFNQDEIRAMKGCDTSKGLPIGYTDKNKFIYYTGNEGMLSFYIAQLLSSDEGFYKLYSSAKGGNKYTYSRASILNTQIPVIVILAHDIGLTKALDLANIKYSISDVKTKSEAEDYIKFKDGYINYPISYSSVLLLNGLKDCDTENMSIKDINSKIEWVNQLENFGGRIKSDGLDNFSDLMYDPISVEVSKDYDLPTTYHEALIYANALLADNKFIGHTDLASNRYRTNEIIAAQFYIALTRAYKEYAIQNKRGRKVKMAIPINSVIDLCLESNTTSDLSIFQPLSELETRAAVSTKGPTGMNSERAYKIDKRGYHNSMINNIAQVTGFASTVGINRQMTINPNIVGGRGYFKKTDIKDVKITDTFSITEALSPFMITSDDPFRNDMAFVQTSKHSTPIKYGSPQLVTNGADAAMPYLVSDMFCHKAKKAGVVKAITKDYLLVEYKDGTSEYVNIAPQTMKNSDGGFYIELKLKTDLKVGDKVKEDTILAYDEKSFSGRVSDGTQLAYNIGCLTKVAILTTEDGYEDSGVCSDWLSEAMSSDIVVMKPISLPASTNVLQIAKVGQEVHEGEPILIFQNAYDEEDANLLLKQLSADEDTVSEIGRNTVKAKVTGVIQDIKIYRTVEMEELSESLKKIVSAKESEIKKLKKIADTSENEVKFDPVGKLANNGKLKKVDGVLIEIYIKYHDKLKAGDKCVCYLANKQVIMDTYKDSEAPYTDFRKGENIDLISSCSSLDGRMLTSIQKTGAINKCMVELSRKVDEIMGIKWKTLHEMYYNNMSE